MLKWMEKCKLVSTLTKFLYNILTFDPWNILDGSLEGQNNKVGSLKDKKYIYMSSFFFFFLMNFTYNSWTFTYFEKKYLNFKMGKVKRVKCEVFFIIIIFFNREELISM